MLINLEILSHNGDRTVHICAGQKLQSNAVCLQVPKVVTGEKEPHGVFTVLHSLHYVYLFSLF